MQLESLLNKINQTQKDLSCSDYRFQCMLKWVCGYLKQKGDHRREEEILRVEEDEKREMECMQQESRRGSWKTRNRREGVGDGGE